MMGGVGPTRESNWPNFFSRSHTWSLVCVCVCASFAWEGYVSSHGSEYAFQETKKGCLDGFFFSKVNTVSAGLQQLEYHPLHLSRFYYESVLAVPLLIPFCGLAEGLVLVPGTKKSLCGRMKLIDWWLIISEKFHWSVDYPYMFTKNTYIHIIICIYYIYIYIYHCINLLYYTYM